MSNKVFSKLKLWPLHPVYAGLLVYALTMSASLYGSVAFSVETYRPGDDPPIVLCAKRLYRRIV